ncbi:hypothetical protein L596_005002 [Steinernema carpocapsae]|uniref:Conserved oligomeric Golgi complex subunit 2 n=1 Tax=Steinernema carpocapsae TaxID=34508 RepID=A0A4V6I8B1_STECR|nr:hypothetical protein L596_005002 [Steinernema carpocapsae]
MSADGGTKRHPAFLPATANDLQLSFNKAHFSRPDFDLERFLSLTRRRVTLDQLYVDLKVYLKVVQNSMIELINDDYADFVNLSSNLVSLQDSIDKIGSDIGVHFDEMCSSTTEVQKAARIVEEKFQELTLAQDEQRRIRGRIAYTVALKALSETLENKPAELNNRWLDFVTHGVVSMEVWHHRNKDIDKLVLEARLECLDRVENYLNCFLASDLKGQAENVSRILSLLTLIGRRDSAIHSVKESVIAPQIGLISTKKLDGILESAINAIKRMQEEWTEMLRYNGQDSESLLSFLDQCLLLYLCDLLDSKFGAVLIPSDNRLFHRCFSMIAAFIKDFRKFPSTVPLLRKIRDKFNLIVYFKLETQQFISKLASQTAEDKFEYTLDESVSRITGPSQVIFAAMENTYNADVYLPSLADKSWDFVLKLKSKYVEWVDKTTTQLADLTVTGTLDGCEAWKCVAILISDIRKVDYEVFDFCMTHIYPTLGEPLNVSTTMFGQCIAIFCNQLNGKREALEALLVKMYADRFEKLLDGVLNIPRQYRWTKKPAPTECSTYLTEAFDSLDGFFDFAREARWDELACKGLAAKIMSMTTEDFCNKACKVLDSVEQTGSSLIKMKGKTTTATSEELMTSSSTSNLESDEGKIRAQLRLDIEHFCAQSNEIDENNNTAIFEKIMDRL